MTNLILTFGLKWPWFCSARALYIGHTTSRNNRSLTYRKAHWITPSETNAPTACLLLVHEAQLFVLSTSGNRDSKPHWHFLKKKGTERIQTDLHFVLYLVIMLKVHSSLFFEQRVKSWGLSSWPSCELYKISDDSQKSVPTLLISFIQRLCVGG